MADQLAEIDPAFGQVVDDDPLAAEDVLDVDQLHLQAELGDVLLADVEFALGLLADAAGFELVFGRHRAEDVPLGRVFQGGDGRVVGLAEHLARLQAAVGLHDDRRRAAVFRRARRRTHAQEPHRTVTDNVFWHRPSV